MNSMTNIAVFDDAELDALVEKAKAEGTYKPFDIVSHEKEVINHIKMNDNYLKNIDDGAIFVAMYFVGSNDFCNFFMNYNSKGYDYVMADILFEFISRLTVEYRDMYYCVDQLYGKRGYNQDNFRIAELIQAMGSLIWSYYDHKVELWTEIRNLGVLLEVFKLNLDVECMGQLG